MFATKISENADYDGYASWDEICSNTAKIDYVNGTGTVAGVNISTDGKEAMVHADDGFYAVIGDTGSGKTCDVVIPYILNNLIVGNSMIITDIKGDIYKTISKTLRKNGYKIVFLNFDDPARGDCVNPLKMIRDEYKNGNVGKANTALMAYAKGIMNSVSSEKDPFWHRTSGEYFVGLVQTLFEYFDEADATIANTLDLHFQGEKKAYGATTVMKSFYSDNEGASAWKLMASTVNAPDATKSSLHSVFVSGLNTFICQNPALIQMLSRTSFEVSDLVDEKTAIFIEADETSLSVHSFMISSLIHQWYSKLVQIAKETNGVLKRKVVFVLDEFGNLPAIEDFRMKISLSRARGISWMLVLQSLAQLELNYGKEEAKAIIGNVSNWIYLHSPDPNLRDYISKVLGEKRNEYTNISERLLSEKMLNQFKKINNEGLTECLMMLGRKRPFMAFLPDISRYYGIESIDHIDIPLREDRDIKEIDFAAVVNAKEKEKKKKNINESREEKIKENRINRETVRMETVERVLALMDVVLGEVKGA
ncbi:MAG: type IV secretory system conjugative DNA transfer family protein [Lachnospiraceae bacterium]|nr:type IV secretory system conjugative DNA transfer family protein [Lachnospiraceae bacterium]